MILDWRVKGFWLPSPVDSASFLDGRPSLFGGSFTWPIMAARRSALDHNLSTLADYCSRHGLLFAPHGKTTMSPTLHAAQLSAGAWAITVASANQALICRNLGSFRLIIANEVLDPVALQWIGNQPDILFYVDSLAAVETVASVSGSFTVLLELGYPGGRTGCRSLADARAIAAAVAAAPGLTLAGVAGYEGGLPSAAEAASYMDFLVSTAVSLRTDGLLAPDTIVSAGGSTYFDVVTSALSSLSGFRPVLRSGAYITHDHGFYQDHTPFLRVPEEGSLQPALELWAQVTSTPEDNLLIAGMGKRDAPHDEGLPVPLLIRSRDGAVRPASGVTVTKLNDHHAYVTAPSDHGIVPGDLICFGISHPCTAFDKWRIIPVVDDTHTVTDLLETYF